MAIFKDNRFTLDSLLTRLQRFEALQKYIINWKDFLRIPQELVAWSLTAYDDWNALISNSRLEQAEKMVAVQTMHTADEQTFNRFLKYSKVIKENYCPKQKYLEIYGLTKPFPKAREARIKMVENLLAGHHLLKAEGDPNVLPDDFISILEDMLETSKNGYTKLISKEKPEAKLAVENQNIRFKEDTKKLQSLYSWILMTWSIYEPFLVQLGFAPRIKRRGHGQPVKPAGLVCDWNLPNLTISWDPSKNATGYQLVYSVNNKDWEEIYNGTETSHTCQPPAGTRSYKVRAGNKKGFSEWSDVVEFVVE